jgi:predicted metalloprotease with PDZ domain
LTLACGLAAPALAETPVKAADGPDLSEYNTPEKATTASVRTVAADRAGLAGYLGVNVTPRDGTLTVAEVQSDSPADKAGVKKGDVVTALDGKTVGRTDTFRELLMSRTPGESVKIAVKRGGESLELTATLSAVSRPMKMGAERLTIGATVTNPKDGDEGTPIERIAADSPAATAGLKVGDVILKIEQNILRRASHLADALAERRVGDEMKLTVRRDGKEIEARVKVIADRGGRPGGGGGRPGGGNFAGPAPTAPWTKPVYRLAVVGLEFADIKHNSKIPLTEWEKALFSKGTYNKLNITGQTVTGSLNDYYLDQSGGALRIEGKVFDWVAVT